MKGRREEGRRKNSVEGIGRYGQCHRPDSRICASQSSGATATSNLIQLGGSLDGSCLRSGTSIGANVEEAQGAQSKRDFITKYSIAHKEARETRYWLQPTTRQPDRLR